MAIQFCLILAIINKWRLRQIDFIMAYLQAQIQCDMYMGSPHGITTWYDQAKDKVLKLLRSIYSQKQAGHVWNEYVVLKLIQIRFEKSNVDEYVFFRDEVIFMLCIDDGIFVAKKSSSQ